MSAVHSAVETTPAKPSPNGLNSTSPIIGKTSAEIEQSDEVAEDGSSHLVKKKQADEAKDTSDAPPLPVEDVPPLPNEAPPGTTQDDGWQPVWEESAQAFYFYNRFTGASQWTNPRIPDAPSLAPGVGSYDRIPAPGTSTEEPRQRVHGGYDPAVHGDYDPSADYAQEAPEGDEAVAQPADPSAIYTATGTFNRFTGKWQPATLAPENFNDENKSRRQMNAFFDVDAAANSHDGKSLKAERSGKKLTKQELKAFKEKRKERKEEKRRAWLRD
ncbi:MAG: hypothetical protein M1836_000552 [Candelina mexicana]|nr:MAG: hypothetical protein M1836_000552 [Candelina mexicana]